MNLSYGWPLIPQPHVFPRLVSLARSGSLQLCSDGCWLLPPSFPSCGFFVSAVFTSILSRRNGAGGRLTPEAQNGFSEVVWKGMLRHSTYDKLPCSRDGPSLDHSLSVSVSSSATKNQATFSPHGHFLILPSASVPDAE